MGKRVAIIQSNYIPWKGYFDIIRAVDEFIVLDDVQYTDRDWRNRNRIKTPAGPQWLTIPVRTGGPAAKIREVVVADPRWADRHWETIRRAYARAAHFRDYAEALEALYRQRRESRLSEINLVFLRAICDLLHIRTPLVPCETYGQATGKTERLLTLCKQAQASEYLSGPAARDYLDTAMMEREGIKVTWVDYSGYPEYRQFHPPFEHGVSILDLLLNEGPRALQFMKTLGA